MCSTAARYSLARDGGGVGAAVAVANAPAICAHCHDASESSDCHSQARIGGLPYHPRSIPAQSRSVLKCPLRPTRPWP